MRFSVATVVERLRRGFMKGLRADSVAKDVNLPLPIILSLVSTKNSI